MAEQHLISILIPVYNAEKFLGACLDSALGQTYSNIEVVAVNDGSTDHSLAILHEYASRDSRLRVIDKPNEGVMPTRRRSIEEARGEYLYFLDADDYISTDAIAKLFHAVEANECDVAISNIMRVSGTYTVSYNQTDPEILRGFGFLSYLLAHKIYSGLAGRLYRRRLFEGMEFFSDISTGEDMLMNIQMASRPDFKGVCMVYDAFYYYLDNGSSLSHRRHSLDYEYLYANRVSTLLDKVPEARELAGLELMLFRVRRVYAYAWHSSNPWLGDHPMAIEAYGIVREHGNELRDELPANAAVIIKLYHRRWGKPLIAMLSTVYRWRDSIRKRLKGRNKQN